jgi:signal transduction histidine kinase
MIWSIRRKLLVAFGLNLLLILALGTFALTQMGVMNMKADFVTGHTIPSLGTADKISATITKYRTLQLEFLINTSSADKQRIEQELIVTETEMQTHFNAYDPLTTTDVEQQALDKVRNGWAAFTEASKTKFLPAVRESNTGSVQPAFSRLNPLYQDLVAASQELTLQSQLQATQALTVVEQTYQRSRLFILANTGLAIAFSSIVGFTLASTIANRVRHLTDATVAVSEGDLVRSVEVRGSDELATLATNFNTMVVRLRTQRSLLEQRNTELRTSLSRQEQLTTDLVVRKEAEEAAYRAKAEAEAASQSKSRFLATMSHELRTPLNAILGYAQVLQLEAAFSGQTENVPHLERIGVAGRHLLTIINNVLDFSKIEAGKMELDLSDIDVRQLADETLAIIEPLAGERGNRVSLECGAIGSMWTDAAKLRQILFNLLSNAVKFTEHGTITLHVWRDVTLDSESVPVMCFEVVDTGIGISPEQQQRLFQPFAQADASITRSYGGTGLGLALTRELCELLGGEISLASTFNQGTTFTVRLPAEPKTNFVIDAHPRAFSPTTEQ